MDWNPPIKSHRLYLFRLFVPLKVFVVVDDVSSFLIACEQFLFSWKTAEKTQNKRGSVTDRDGDVICYSLPTPTLLAPRSIALSRHGHARTFFPTDFRGKERLLAGYFSELFTLTNWRQFFCVCPVEWSDLIVLQHLFRGHRSSRFSNLPYMPYLFFVWARFYWKISFKALSIGSPGTIFRKNIAYLHSSSITEMSN